MSVGPQADQKKKGDNSDEANQSDIEEPAPTSDDDFYKDLQVPLGHPYDEEESQ